MANRSAPGMLTMPAVPGEDAGRTRFETGQQVLCNLPGASRGIYRVVRQLPMHHARTAVQYRVRHLRDGHERVVDEANLLVLPLPAGVAGVAGRRK